MTETEMILTSILDCSPMDLYVNRPKLSESQKQRFDAMSKRVRNGEPLQYVIGECDFIDAQLSVDSNVLIPRPETEIMTDYARTVLDDLNAGFKKILDLGTGSGNIPISLAQSLENAHIITVDISSEASHLALINAKRNHVEDKITFICQDMCTFLKTETSLKESFDMIISNPPYIKTADLPFLPANVQKEPKLALDGGEDGLDFYRLIIAHADYFLKSGAFLLLEIGDDQRNDVELILNQNMSFYDVQFLKDYRTVDRVAVARKM